MATPSAGHRLSHVPELLEMILLNLNTDEKPDLITLFNCKPVSRAFHNTITGSTKFQQNLCLLPPILPPAEVSQDPAMNLLIESSTANKQLPDGSWASIGPFPYQGLMIHLRFSPTIPTNTDASWRRMYLYKTRYAIRWVGLRERGQPDIIIKGYWSNPTLGELVDAIFEATMKGEGRGAVAA